MYCRFGDADLNSSTHFIRTWREHAGTERVAAIVAEISTRRGVRLPQLFLEKEYPWPDETLRRGDTEEMCAIKMASEFVSGWLRVQRRYFRELPDLLDQEEHDSTITFRVTYADGRSPRDEEMFCLDGDLIVELLEAVEEDRNIGVGRNVFGKGIMDGRLWCMDATRYAYEGDLCWQLNLCVAQILRGCKGWQRRRGSSLKTDSPNKSPKRSTYLRVGQD